MTEPKAEPLSLVELAEKFVTDHQAFVDDDDAGYDTLIDLCGDFIEEAAKIVQEPKQEPPTASVPRKQAEQKYRRTLDLLLESSWGGAVDVIREYVAAQAQTIQRLEGELRRATDNAKWWVGQQEKSDAAAEQAESTIQQLQDEREKLLLVIKANGRIDSPEVARVIDNLKAEHQRLTAGLQELDRHLMQDSMGVWERAILAADLDALLTRTTEG